MLYSRRMEKDIFLDMGPNALVILKMIRFSFY